jgi:hypothetical protein
MADMLTIDMPENQEDKDNEHNEDKEPCDNDLVLPVVVENAMINRPVDPVGWQFHGRDGKWMLEDNDLELKNSVLDYFRWHFHPMH